MKLLVTQGIEPLIDPTLRRPPCPKQIATRSNKSAASQRAQCIGNDEGNTVVGTGWSKGCPVGMGLRVQLTRTTMTTTSITTIGALASLPSVYWTMENRNQTATNKYTHTRHTHPRTVIQQTESSTARPTPLTPPPLPHMTNQPDTRRNPKMDVRLITREVSSTQTRTRTRTR